MSADPVALLAEIAEIGRDAERGGYSRHLFDDADLELREWFERTASLFGLKVERDRNANLWAWWDPPSGRVVPAIATGSHLDSVPGGGALDGPLGVVSALVAVGRMRALGFVPRRSIAVIAFAEEEGSRFQSACLGSRLMTGELDGSAARALTDDSGTTLQTLLAANGVDPNGIGGDPERLEMLAAFVELHVEQGRQLAPVDAPLGLATSILAHGRWTLTVNGRGDHAGSTELDSRHDPMVVAAKIVLAARAAAEGADPSEHARATVGRVIAVPGAVNAIPSSVRVSLDARAALDEHVLALIDAVRVAAEAAATEQGCTVEVRQDSFSTRVLFDEALTDRLGAVLVATGRGEVPRIPTGAGHDAGILAPHLPTAMLFVRNPTGVSHAPDEGASDEDIRLGAAALEDVLRELAGDSP